MFYILKYVSSNRTGTLLVLFIFYPFSHSKALAHPSHPPPLQSQLNYCSWFQLGYNWLPTSPVGSLTKEVIRQANLPPPNMDHLSQHNLDT